MRDDGSDRLIPTSVWNRGPAAVDGATKGLIKD